MTSSCKSSIRWRVDSIRRQGLPASTLAFNKRCKDSTLKPSRKSIFEDSSVHRKAKMQRTYKGED